MRLISRNDKQMKEKPDHEGRKKLFTGGDGDVNKERCRGKILRWWVNVMWGSTTTHGRHVLLGSTCLLSVLAYFHHGRHPI